MCSFLPLLKVELRLSLRVCPRVRNIFMSFFLRFSRSAAEFRPPRSVRSRRQSHQSLPSESQPQLPADADGARSRSNAKLLFLSSHSALYASCSDVPLLLLVVLQVNIQPSEWHRALLLPQAWRGFMSRAFHAVLLVWNLLSCRIQMPSRYPETLPG